MMLAQENASVRDDTLSVEPAVATGLPLRVSPRAKGTPTRALLSRLERIANEHLEKCGAILFRGFALENADAFRGFASALSGNLLRYEFGSTPRTRVTQGVYTSTEYPAHQVIPLHNEQSYSRDWPMRIFFYCALASPVGGETPIADSRLIYRRVDPSIRKRFEDRRLMYVRNFGNGLDVPWSQVFDTHDRSRVERYCSEHGIDFEWKDDGNLRTRQVCQAVARHPRTAELVWFNQAHLFHVSALDGEAREALLEVVSEEDLPRNVYYGDGSPIEDSVLAEIRGVLEEAQVVFPWATGDILMLDNMLTAHGRNRFKGDRKVIVAMAEPHVGPPGAAVKD